MTCQIGFAIILAHTDVSVWPGVVLVAVLIAAGFPILKKPSPRHEFALRMLRVLSDVQEGNIQSGKTDGVSTTKRKENAA